MLRNLVRVFAYVLKFLRSVWCKFLVGLYLPKKRVQESMTIACKKPAQVSYTSFS